MKKILLGAFAALVAVGFTSCKDDDTKVYYSYGTVQEKVSGEDLKIRKDAGAYLTVKGTTAGLKTGDRVIVSYEVVGKFTEGGDNTVKLWSYPYEILTKDIRLKSVIDGDEAEDTKLGNDGFVDMAAWYGGEYLNLDFRMLFGRGQSKPHFINLVADDAYEGNTMTVVLRHNAEGAVPGGSHVLYPVDGIVSFRLVDLFAELEIAEADYPEHINVKWEKYENSGDPETVTQTIPLGKFKPWTVGGKEPKKADIVRTSAEVE